MSISNLTEAKAHYQRARKQGLRTAGADRTAGGSGRLPVLDARREECGVLALMTQKMRPISLARVTGTYQSSRGNSFAPDYMPVLPEDTEFASKWVALCDAHVSSGIRDPIRVYEYLWNYYVAEGNKRVSVLKYFGAGSFEAEITRLIPQADDDDPVLSRYYTFLAYLRKGGVFSDIELSRSTKYERLYLIEQELTAALGNAEPPDYNMLYIRFETVYLTTDCTMTLGDAFLEYLHIYGFPTGVLPEELAERIHLLKPQMDILEHAAEPTLVLEEYDETPPLFSRILSARKNPKIVFAYTEGRTEQNWLGAHERGRLAMQAEFGDRVESCCIDGLDRSNGYERLVETAGEAGLLFAASSTLIDPVLRFALEHSGCLSFVYSRLQHHHRVHTYFGRYYEAMFLCGAAAGMRTKSGVISYVTPQLDGARFTSDINAFAIGVHSVRPDARVLLVTRGVIPSDPLSCAQALGLSASMGVDVVLTPHYETLTLPDLPKSALSVLVTVDGYGYPQTFLAAPDWNWDRFYIAIVRSYLNGSLGELLSDDSDESPVKSFWWGIGAGVINIHIGEAMTGASCNLIRYLRGCIARNQYQPFHGPVTGMDGALHVPSHNDPTPIDIMTMRYLTNDVELVE